MLIFFDIILFSKSATFGQPQRKGHSSNVCPQVLWTVCEYEIKAKTVPQNRYNSADMKMNGNELPAEKRKCENQSNLNKTWRLVNKNNLILVSCCDKYSTIK